LFRSPFFLTTSVASIFHTAAPAQPADVPPRRRARDLLFLLLLAIGFFILMRPTFMDPYYWDAGEIAVMATHIQHGFLNPMVKHYPDEGHPVLIHELYAAGWLVLGDHQIWWPHVVVFVLSFLTLLYSYRIGLWLGSGNPFVGLAAAALIMLDPLFLAESSGIHVCAPSVGLATAALYYLLIDRPKAFALAASLTILTYIPTSIFAMCLMGTAVLLYWRRNPRSLIWYLVPGFVFAAWLVLHRLSYGYFVSDPIYWAVGQRSLSLNAAWLGHIRGNLHEVFQHSWRLPFTIIAVIGGLLLLASMLLRQVPSLASFAQSWFERLGSHRAARLLLVLAIGILIYLPTISAITGGVLLARYLMILMVPLFLLAVYFLQATKIPWLWLGVCVLLGWNLRAHWYDHKSSWDRCLEETLLCRRVVRLEVQAARFLATRFPSATILTAYPHQWELSDPVGGYVSRPLNIKRSTMTAPDTPVDLIYYSSVTLPAEDARMFEVIDRQGARPIQSFSQGDIKMVVLKTGENLDVPECRYAAVLLSSPLQVPINHVFEVSAAFQNLGRNPWAAPTIPRYQQGNIEVGYRWERNGELLPESGKFRVPLQHDYFWGETAVAKIFVHAPPQPGHYVLVLDLVGPGDTWFAQAGNTPIRVNMGVSPIDR
jgi:hypothetical protein